LALLASLAVQKGLCNPPDPQQRLLFFTALFLIVVHPTEAYMVVRNTEIRAFSEQRELSKRKGRGFH